ncbi:MAG: DUF4886 domain-containing protein [Oscillospiraceae bacterium]|nr:DUF4886 domain-containing protein [Oscillospiraceae bacterium]
MKVLSIGNSFSQDAHKWLHQLAVMNGVEMETLNLYVSGCSLARHWANVEANAEVYGCEPNGTRPPWKISIEGALKMTDWDVVTLQQASGVSGQIESYEPYLSGLVALIRNLQPKAEIWFHQTWAYEIDSPHRAFENYGCSQQKMYDCLVSATEAAAASIPARIIPAGRLVQTLRTTVPEFDYANGGLSLCRDGYHMTHDYGRFAVAALWVHTLTGKTVEAAEFEDFDPALLQKILAVVNAQ